MTRPNFITRGTVFAIVAATVPAVVQGAAETAGLARVALLGIVALVTALSTVGVRVAAARPGPNALRVTLAAQLVAVSAALWVSRGSAFVLAMPLVSIVTLYLTSAEVLLVTGLLMAVLLGVLSTRAPAPQDLLFAVLGLGSSFVFVVVFSLLARRERTARAEVERLSAEVSRLAADRERNRIAREIHDGLGHCLTAANVQLEAARAERQVEDPRLDRVQELLREGLRELRRSVSVLREPAQPVFTRAIADLVADSNAPDLAVTWTCDGSPRPVPQHVGFALYRVAQEALTNVRRHANAGRAAVHLVYHDGKLVLTVTDDGRGAGPEEPGLIGVRERVLSVGGALEVDAPPSGGLRVRVEVPA